MQVLVVLLMGTVQIEYSICSSLLMLYGISSTNHIIRVTWTSVPTQTDTISIPDFSYLFVSFIRFCAGGELFILGSTWYTGHGDAVACHFKICYGNRVERNVIIGVLVHRGFEEITVAPVFGVVTKISSAQFCRFKPCDTV